MYRTVNLIVFVSVIAVGLANPATQLNCGDVETKCQVSNVDITPCAKQERCLFKIGKNASISFDFTPEFSASEVSTLVTSTFQGQEVSLPGFDTDACKVTPCPVQAGKKQTLKYNLELKRRQMAKIVNGDISRVRQESLVMNAFNKIGAYYVHLEGTTLNGPYGIRQTTRRSVVSTPGLS